MESRNKYSMCRLCLCENECFVNIFEENDWNGYVAAAVITDLLQFQVSDRDGYPHVICSSCLNKITDFKVFKEQCQTSRITYDNVFATANEHEVERITVKVEPMDEEDDDEDEEEEEEVNLKGIEVSDDGDEDYSSNNVSSEQELLCRTPKAPAQVERDESIREDTSVIREEDPRSDGEEIMSDEEENIQDVDQKLELDEAIVSKQKVKRLSVKVESTEDYNNKEGHEEEEEEEEEEEVNSKYFSLEHNQEDEEPLDKKVRKRQSITLAKKLEIISKIESGVRASTLSREYKLSPSTVRTIWQNAEKNKAAGSRLSASRSKITLPRNPLLEKMEDLLSTWIDQQNWIGIPPTSTTTRTKALEVYKDLVASGEKPPKEKFLASQGWYENFCKRQKLKKIKLKNGSPNVAGRHSFVLQANLTSAASEENDPLFREKASSLFQGDLGHQWKNSGANIARRKVITLGLKLEIIKKLESGISAAELGRLYDMNESSIRTIKKNAEKIKDCLAKSGSLGAKITTRMRKPLLEKMEALLSEWVQRQRWENVVAPSSVEVRRKALSIYMFLKSEEGESDMEPFSASKGWYDRFCKRQKMLMERQNELMKEEDDEDDSIKDYQNS